MIVVGNASSGVDYSIGVSGVLKKSMLLLGLLKKINLERYTWV